MIIKNSVIYGVETKNNATIALQDKSVTENGTYTADSGYDGLGTVTVNVSGGGDNEYDTWIFENISGQTADLTFNGLYKNGSYSLDEGVTWIDLPSDSDGWSTNTSHTINFDNIVYVKYNDVLRDYSTYMFTCNKRYNLSGDLYKSYKPYMYSHAFDYNSNLIDASGLVFHGDTAGFHSLDRMFNTCNSLTTAPAILPATKLWNYCYYNMFYQCRALTQAPVLPATTLASSCYGSMFSGCESLATPPALPATTLADYCYSNMFYGCKLLTTAPALPVTTLAQGCYSSMFYNCTSLTTAPALPATTLAENCYKNMFSNCIRLTTAPALPATTLANSCYREMFNYCTSLTTAPTLPATTLADFCYMQMFYTSGVNTVITYAQDISASNCLYNWLYGASNTGDLYNLGGATYPSGASGIPSGWTEHTSL